MKLTAFLLFVACFQVSARSFSQTITLSLKNISLEKAFKEIKKQSGYMFVYIRDQIDHTKKIDLEVTNVDLNKVLQLCFKDQPLTYAIVDNYVVIKGKEDTLATKKKEPTPLNIIAGVITDADGNPLSGVSVVVKGTKKGTKSDDAGKFNLSDAENNEVLIFSFIGFESQEIRIDKPSLNIRLQRIINSLDETVVIAYGSTTKRLNTGNVSTVNAVDIKKQPVDNVLEALQGRVPGMLISQNTGAINGSLSVQIRGQNSIANGNDPLYVIDGVPYTPKMFTNINNAAKGGNPLNFINPSDIESVDVLKDADATAIYGSQGANGVVLITTKKGKAASTKVDLNFFSGFGQVTRTIDWLNTKEYLQMRYEAIKNDGTTITDPNIYAPDLLTWDTTRYTDWQKLLIGGKAHYLNGQASISGGNANTQYLVGLGYQRQTTVFPGDQSDQKANVHFNINSLTNNKKFRFQLSGNYVYDKSNLTPVDFTSQLIQLPPDAPPVHNIDGSLNWANSTWPNSNPYAYLELNYKAHTSNLVSNAVLGYQLLPGLELKANLGYANMQVNEIVTWPTTYYDPANNVTSGASSFNTMNIRTWIIEPQITYQGHLGENNFSALIGTTFQQNTTDGQWLDARGFSSDALLENIQAATSVTVSSVINTHYKYNAIFARLNYNWKEKYLVNLTARRDGSSRFGPGRQFANFGAAGAAWVFSKERFFENGFPFLSFGKIRASYGITGNDQIGDYRYIDLYTNTTNPYQNSQGLYASNLFNPDPEWEVNKKGELGLELGFLKDRVFFSASYYRNRSSNQLLSYSLSAVTGFQTLASNLPAVVQNTGWEFSISSTNIKTKNFRWTSSLNLTIPRNKLVSYPNFSSSPYQNTFILGESIFIRRVYHSIGVDPGTGIYQFANSKGNPTFNPTFPDDLITTVNTYPKFYGGFQNGFQYKNLSLDFFLQFVKQTAPNYLSFLLVPPGSAVITQPSDVLNRWQKPGDAMPVERYNQDYSLFNALTYAQQSDLAFSDASYIRLKNVSISYQFSEILKQKMHLQNLRIYLQGQNLLTITHYTGFDPETQSFTALPPLRVFTAGVQMTF